MYIGSAHDTPSQQFQDIIHLIVKLPEHIQTLATANAAS